MLESRIVSSIDAIDAHAWDALGDANNPFLDHAFLRALERSGSVGSPESGWVVSFVGVYESGVLLGAMPLYLKFDSYGEYIFDWAWASGAMRAGLPYYPKLVCAIPFTPATGPRLLVHPDADQARVRKALIDAARELGARSQASSIHALFIAEHERDAFQAEGFLLRTSLQFHWLAQVGQRNFDDYLAAMRASTRKQIKRERKTAASHGFEIVMLRGDALAPRQWKAVEDCYRDTCARKGAIAYLTPRFFSEIRATFAHRTMVALASKQGEPLATALFFHKGRHLYGRYWGSLVEADALHFELCYYQPIAWALENGIDRFEAGAQGEHKLKRGLIPRPCYSAHDIAHAGLRAGVAAYIQQEEQAVRCGMAQLSEHLPFKIA